MLCHGFGAPGDDLVQLGQYFQRILGADAERMTFVFPHAPISLAEGGFGDSRAWWHLDMERLNQAITSGDFRDMRRESPAELPHARTLFTQVVTELSSELEIPASRVVVGGFSQGSMLATDYALHAESKPAGLIVWSGTLLNEDVWRPLAPSLAKLPIFQSHGTTDPILPFEAAKWLHDLFRESGADAEFLEFRGPHTIPPEAIQNAALLIKEVLDTSSADNS
ncbi:Phospholipase/Carboxylesterase [Thalassoglobus neptunius]|uniref:Phospholipase/Carboxylesterase n=1 Tax=Thalassoglobus neptunius TaxID=1938619 RepID=A0A5C5X3F6_9PLAN|nr:Phospholipase/Carboxylesterase [Thalassoglobus neptunius]